MFKQIARNIYLIEIPLPNNPLKSLNSYLIKGIPSNGERNLLIDTGFNKTVCFEAMMNALSALDVHMEDTDIYLTHAHSDHIGLVPRIVTPTTKVFLNRIDMSYQLSWLDPSINDETLEGMIAYGFTEEEFYNSPFYLDAHFREVSFRDYLPVDDGDIFSYGGYHFTAVHTPGHSPGHMCLYEKSEKIFIGGDLILCDITPNISSYLNVPDSLGDYIRSLLKIRDFDISLFLPGHRTMGSNYRERAFQIIEHHGRRVNETYRMLKDHPGVTLYQLASYMTWQIRYDGNWKNFPLAQKPFAVHEVAAHLDYLYVRGEVDYIVNSKGQHIYYIKSL